MAFPIGTLLNHHQCSEQSSELHFHKLDAIYQNEKENVWGACALT